ncbi:hypothetical protein FPSM_00290 [Flavobacterium psychrophilum]|nr:hypothetical protein FPSM_00290 [Flavobacterium psychrophilum]
MLRNNLLFWGLGSCFVMFRFEGSFAYDCVVFFMFLE